MTKVKVRAGARDAPAAADTAETPTQEVIRQASKAVTVTDANGRVITVKRLSPLQRMKLLEILGPSLSQNEAYFGQAALAAAVREIDGDTVPFPASKRELEAMVVRLDDAGFEAVNRAAFEIAGYTVDADGNIVARDAKAEAAAAKN